MKSFIQLVLLIAVIFTLALLVDQITLLKQFAVALEHHPEPFRGITIALSMVGWVLMIGMLAFGLVNRSQPMSQDEAQHFLQTGIKRITHGRIAGRHYRTVATLTEIKQAFRNGEWLHDSSWWPIWGGLIALVCIAFGMFGYFIVIGPLLVKLICIGVLLYAFIRTLWAFAKA